MANSLEDRAKGGRATRNKAVIKLKGRLPLKEYKVLEGRFMHGMTLEDSARHAGMDGNVSTMKARAHQIIAKNQNSNGALILAMAEVGINPDTLAVKIQEGLKSTMFIKKKVGKDLEQLVEVPDHHARHKFVETVIDVSGSRAPKKIEIEQKTFEQRLLEITLRRG